MRKAQSAMRHALPPWPPEAKRTDSGKFLEKVFFPVKGLFKYKFVL
jgi:hypothetical protein